MVRRALVYHMMAIGHRHVSAASTLVMGEHGPALELDPQVLGKSGVVVAIEPARLRELSEDGWIYGYAETVDRRRRVLPWEKLPPPAPGVPQRRAKDRPTA